MPQDAEYIRDEVIFRIMRPSILLLLTISSTLGGPALQGQTDEHQRGGRSITSVGQLHVLVVLVRFPDDNDTSRFWPDPSVLPPWASSLVAPDSSASGDYDPGSASHWFWENSYGLFHVTGDVYYVTLPRNESYYHELANPSRARGLIETEALDALDEAPYNVDFRKYDRWTYSPFRHRPGGDGILDMCWVITRNLHDEWYPEEDAKQLKIDKAALEVVNKTYGGVTVLSGYTMGRVPASCGTGFFAKYYQKTPSNLQAKDGEYTTVNVIAHEMSHFLFGPGHFAKFDGMDGHELAPNRSLSNMAHYVGGWAGHYSGYEKWRLGWLTPLEVAADTRDPVLLHDLATTRDPRKTRLIKIPVPGTSQFFLLENRRMISPLEAHFPHWQHGAPTPLGPGVLVYHIIEDRGLLTTSRVKMLAADGKWTWNVTRCGGNARVEYDDYFVRDTPDPFKGYDENEWIYTPGCPARRRAIYWANELSKTGGYLVPTNFQGWTHSAGDDHGDRYDLFDVGEVITPFSNPGSHRWSAPMLAFQPTTIGIEIGSFDPATQAYTIIVRHSDPFTDLRPSKPMDLRASPNPGHRVELRWAANSEPDLAGYNIYRGVTYRGGPVPSFLKLNRTAVDSSFYTDTDSSLSGINVPDGSTVVLRYRVTSIDRSEKESARSDSVEVIRTRSE